MTDTGFSLRRARATDAPAMWAIRADAIRQTCRSHYPEAMLEKWASGPLPETFPSKLDEEYSIVGVAGSTVAGFAALKAANAQIEAVFVSPRYGRCGLGRMLVAHLETVAAEAGLPALGLCASLNAVPFYRAAGYNAISEGIYTTSAGVKIASVRMQKRLGNFQERA